MAIAAGEGCSRVTRDESPRSASKVIVSGILINLLNYPKLTIFFFVFLPQFVSRNEPNATMRMLGLSGIFMLATFVVFADLRSLGGRGRDPMSSPGRGS